LKRIDVVERAAARLWAGQSVAASAASPAERIELLCKTLALEIQVCPGADVMLGGAYSRLQLWDWARPALGGIIWLSDDLDAETRRFASAHELGHYALHRGERIAVFAPCAPSEVDQQADPERLRSEDHRVQEYAPRVRRELEASAFAAELLAPRATVRRLFTADTRTNAERLATHFGISRLLAARRLLDAVLAPSSPGDHTPDAASAPDETSPPNDPAALLARLDASQRLAARAGGPALIVAGPGTGKTATLVGRVASLVLERYIPPERVLALTFSNRAADEMRERLMASGLPGERMPIMTIHAFATTLLREYASRVPHAADEAQLSPDFRILDQANAYLLMEELLGEMPLHYYRVLGNPTASTPTLLDDFSHARDALLTPAAYAALVDAMPLAPESLATPEQGQHKKAHPPDGTFTTEQIARARERAAAYAVWDRALRRRGLVDFGGLIQRAVELLHENDDVLADVRARYPELLVDEFQDTNRAAAELLLLVSGQQGNGLWVVGDQNQAIYRFRGASPGNLPRLVEQYPGLRILTLRRCYRAVPEIVRLGSAMAARMAELAPTPLLSATAMPEASEALRQAMRPLLLEAARGDGDHPAVWQEETFASAAHEGVGIAAAIARQKRAGYTYSDLAVLCRTHKQARAMAAVLASQGIPVSLPGDFFERSEVKDALALLSLAAGPDVSGILRAAPLVVALGYPAPTKGELAATVRHLASERHPLPWALRDRETLSRVSALAAGSLAGLARLGEVATELHNSPGVGSRLAAFLLHPGGYGWRLARVADGLDGPQRDDSTGRDGGADGDSVLPVLESASQAQQALSALGELVRLAWSFDLRWTQEPDFRARLERAVTRRRGTPLAAADTLTPPPNADALPTASLPGARVPATADAPAVRSFLHYLHALRLTAMSVPIPASDEDAVHVLTLHQSKGLEFPVVFLPGLARGQFPANTAGREEVHPPGFRESDAPGEHEAEERCLFYVGVTRARDAVTLTRAISYSRTSETASRTAERSPLLALLEDAPGWRNAPPLLSAEEYNHLLAVASAMAETSDEADDDEAKAGEKMRPASRATTAPAAKPEYPLHDLEQYLACPRQYKYARDYGLFDSAENAVNQFHRYIRRGMQALRDIQAARPDVRWESCEPRLRTLWQQEGPAGHSYDAFYWRATEKILREEWQAITASDGAASGRVTLAQPLKARLSQCVVTLTADRVIAGAAASQTVLVRLHTGRPRESDRKDLRLPLYYLAHLQQHPGTHVEIALAYAGNALENDTNNTSNAANPANAGRANGPRALEHVTEEARKAAERYLDPTRRSRSALDKLDEAALGIAARQFPPRPNEARCAACAYCYVCPSDPESDPETTSESASVSVPLP
jgi:DNA helicase II / ATP-dependent DNA helicase PcrA